MFLIKTQFISFRVNDLDVKVTLHLDGLNVTGGIPFTMQVENSIPFKVQQVHSSDLVYGETMLIKVDQLEIDKQKPCTKGVHKFKLNGVSEKPNKTKDGTNWLFDFECIGSSEPENVGRHAFHNVSSKAIGMGFVPMAAALMDVPVDDFKADDYEVNTLKSRECYIDVQPEVYEGKISNKPKTFYSTSYKPEVPF